MSKHFEKVKKYYETGVWSKAKVYNVVTNPKNNAWITEEEYKLITGEEYR